MYVGKKSKVGWNGTLFSFFPLYMETIFFLIKLKVTIHVSYNPILNYKNISKLDKSELNFSLLDASRRNVLKVFMISNFSKSMNLTAIGSFGMLEYTIKYN